MTDYISREALMRKIEEEAHEWGEDYDAWQILGDIEDFPAADVRSVVRAKWQLDSDPGEPWRYVCDKCGEKTTDTVMGKPRVNYCPNCGADMRDTADG